jgi:hypothetical protein
MVLRHLVTWSPGHLIIWGAVGLAVSIRTLLYPERHTVFPVFAGGAAHWWADQPLYADYAPVDFFRYPPSFAIAITPLQLLGPCLGGIVWAWLNLFVYGAGVWSFLRHVLPVRWTAGRETAYLLLALFGALRGLWNGQSNALAIGLVLLGVAAAVRGRWWRAAWLLGGSIAVKLTPAAPVLLLCAIWPRKLAGRQMVVLLVLGLAPFLTRSPEMVSQHYEDWFGHLSNSAPERWPGFRDGWTMFLVWLQYSGQATGPLPLKEPIQGHWYHLLGLAGAAGALAWCLRQRRGLAQRELATVTLSMGLGWLMLLGPAVEHATYAFLAPLLAWALLEDNGPYARCLSGCAGFLILVLGWGSLIGSLLPSIPWLWAALPLGTMLFLLWLVVFARRLRAATWDGCPDPQPERLKPLRSPPWLHVSKMSGTTTKMM